MFDVMITVVDSISRTADFVPKYTTVTAEGTA